MGGSYAGHILYVNLTTQEIWDRQFPDPVLRRYIGGSALALYLMQDWLGERLYTLTPEDPDNPLVFMTGPLTGTPLPSTSRMTVSAISPLTGVWGESNAGGFLGAELKMVGYDGIFITGASSEPVVLVVEDGPSGVRLEAAPQLWGKDTDEAYQILRRWPPSPAGSSFRLRMAGQELVAGATSSQLRAPDPESSGKSPRRIVEESTKATDLMNAEVRRGGLIPAQVAVIGPAGENGVRYASIVHNQRHVFGRTGMGTVMGYKRLKALVVRAQEKGRNQPWKKFWYGEMAEKKGQEGQEGQERQEGKEGMAERSSDLLADAQPGPEKEPWRGAIGRKEAGDLRARLLEKCRHHIAIEMLNTFGTNGSLELGYFNGDVPIKYWRQGEWAEGNIEALGGSAYNEKILTGKTSCYACPVACKRELAGRKPGPEYEAVAGFGPLLLNSDLEKVAQANDLCNRLGLDVISTSSTIALALAAAERDLWPTAEEVALFPQRAPVKLEVTGPNGTSSAAGGPAPKGNGPQVWGDPEVLLRLIEDIAQRKRAGSILALGARGVLEHLAGLPEAQRRNDALSSVAPDVSDRAGSTLSSHRPETAFSVVRQRADLESLDCTVKGLEAPYHDPRAYHGLGLDYATGPRGACHVSSLTLNIELGASSFPGLGLMAGDLPAQSGEGKAALVKKAQDLGTIFLGAAMFCALGGIPFDEEDFVSALRLATGFDYDLAELMSSGERVWMEKRLLNLRRGLTQADDHLPRVHSRPLESGPAAGSLPDMSLLLEEYYRRRGLDPATGWPTPAKLKELGLIPWPVTNYTGTIWSSNRLDR